MHSQWEMYPEELHHTIIACAGCGYRAPLPAFCWDTAVLDKLANDPVPGERVRLKTECPNCERTGHLEMEGKEDDVND
jgi:hypothetical protein